MQQCTYVYHPMFLSHATFYLMDPKFLIQEMAQEDIHGDPPTLDNKWCNYILLVNRCIIQAVQNVDVYVNCTKYVIEICMCSTLVIIHMFYIITPLL